MLHAVPPMSAPDALTRCKQLINEAGFVDVNQSTLQHKKYQNVFAIGDSSGSPNSKTAASAGEIMSEVPLYNITTTNIFLIA